jgi:hypothetical protein
MMRIVCAVLALALCPVAAHAQQNETGGPEVWDFSNPAAPRHWFTGLTCWPDALSLPLTRRTAFEPTGGDVGCFYSARGQDYYVTVYATTRWDLNAPLQLHVDQTWSEIRSRYAGGTELANGERTIATPAGALVVRELVLQVDGTDTLHNSRMRGVTGAWLADIGGWTLKVRLTGGAQRNLQWARESADAVLARASGEMNVARNCSRAGAERPPQTEVSGEAATALTLLASVMSVQLADAVPLNPAAARAAGYVCLGLGLRTAEGHHVAAVMLPGTASALPNGMQLLSLGEIRNTPNAPMVAVVAFDAGELLGVSNAPVHLVYAFEESRVSYLGLAEQPPRESAAYGAAHVADRNEPDTDPQR